MGKRIRRSRPCKFYREWNLRSFSRELHYRHPPHVHHSRILPSHPVAEHSLRSVARRIVEKLNTDWKLVFLTPHDEVNGTFTIRPDAPRCANSALLVNRIQIRNRPWREKYILRKNAYVRIFFLIISPLELREQENLISFITLNFL